MFNGMANGIVVLRPTQANSCVQFAEGGGKLKLHFPCSHLRVNSVRTEVPDAGSDGVVGCWCSPCWG